MLLYLHSVPYVFVVCFLYPQGVLGLLDLQGVRKDPSVADVGSVAKVASTYSTVLLPRIYVDTQWCGYNFRRFTLFVNKNYVVVVIDR